MLKGPTNHGVESKRIKTESQEEPSQTYVDTPEEERE